MRLNACAQCEKMSFQFFSNKQANKQSLSSLVFLVRLSVCVVVNLIYALGRCFEFSLSLFLSFSLSLFLSFSLSLFLSFSLSLFLSFSSFLSKITFSPSFTFLSMQGTRQSNPSDAILNVFCLFHSLDNALQKPHEFFDSPRLGSRGFNARGLKHFFLREFERLG